MIGNIALYEILFTTYLIKLPYTGIPVTSTDGNGHTLSIYIGGL